jgi:hypothetical protein
LLKFAVAILWPLIAPLADASIVYIGSFADYQPSRTAGFWFAANMSRYNLTDFEWRVIKPHLPNKPRGVRRVDDRRVASMRLWLRAYESTA